MKALVSSLILLISSVAIACPDLAGTYSCNVQNRSSEATVTQKSVPGGAAYTIVYDDGTYSETEEIIADGKKRNIVLDPDFLKSSTQVAKCNGKILNVRIDGKGHDGTILKSETNITLVNNQLNIHVKGEIKKGPLKDVFEEKLVCDKK